MSSSNDRSISPSRPVVDPSNISVVVHRSFPSSSAATSGTSVPRASPRYGPASLLGDSSVARSYSSGGYSQQQLGLHHETNPATNTTYFDSIGRGSGSSHIGAVGGGVDLSTTASARHAAQLRQERLILDAQQQVKDLLPFQEQSTRLAAELAIANQRLQAQDSQLRLWREKAESTGSEHERATAFLSVSEANAAAAVSKLKRLQSQADADAEELHVLRAEVERRRNADGRAAAAIAEAKQLQEKTDAATARILAAEQQATLAAKASAQSDAAASSATARAAEAEQNIQKLKLENEQLRKRLHDCQMQLSGSSSEKDSHRSKVQQYESEIRTLKLKIGEADIERSLKQSALEARDTLQRRVDELTADLTVSKRQVADLVRMKEQLSMSEKEVLTAKQKANESMDQVQREGRAMLQAVITVTQDIHMLRQRLEISTKVALEHLREEESALPLLNTNVGMNMSGFGSNNNQSAMLNSSNQPNNLSSSSSTVNASLLGADLAMNGPSVTMISTVLTEGLAPLQTAISSACECLDTVRQRHLATERHARECEEKMLQLKHQTEKAQQTLTAKELQVTTFEGRHAHLADELSTVSKFAQESRRRSAARYAFFDRALAANQIQINNRTSGSDPTNKNTLQDPTVVLLDETNTDLSFEELQNIDNIRWQQLQDKLVKVLEEGRAAILRANEAEKTVNQLNSTLAGARKQMHEVRQEYEISSSVATREAAEATDTLRGALTKSVLQQERLSRELEKVKALLDETTLSKDTAQQELEQKESALALVSHARDNAEQRAVQAEEVLRSLRVDHNVLAKDCRRAHDTNQRLLAMLGCVVHALLRLRCDAAELLQQRQLSLKQVQEYEAAMRVLATLSHDDAMKLTQSVTVQNALRLSGRRSSTNAEAGNGHHVPSSQHQPPAPVSLAELSHHHRRSQPSSSSQQHLSSVAAGINSTGLPRGSTASATHAQSQQQHKHSQQQHPNTRSHAVHSYFGAGRRRCTFREAVIAVLAMNRLKRCGASFSALSRGKRYYRLRYRGLATDTTSYVLPLPASIHQHQHAHHPYRQATEHVDPASHLEFPTATNRNPNLNDSRSSSVGYTQANNHHPHLQNNPKNGSNAAAAVSGGNKIPPLPSYHEHHHELEFLPDLTLSTHQHMMMNTSGWSAAVAAAEILGEKVSETPPLIPPLPALEDVLTTVPITAPGATLAGVVEQLLLVFGTATAEAIAEQEQQAAGSLTTTSPNSGGGGGNHKATTQVASILAQLRGSGLDPLFLKQLGIGLSHSRHPPITSLQFAKSTAVTIVDAMRLIHKAAVRYEQHAASLAEQCYDWKKRYTSLELQFTDTSKKLATALTTLNNSSYNVAGEDLSLRSGPMLMQTNTDRIEAEKHQLEIELRKRTDREAHLLQQQQQLRSGAKAAVAQLKRNGLSVPQQLVDVLETSSPFSASQASNTNQPINYNFNNSSRNPAIVIGTPTNASMGTQPTIEPDKKMTAAEAATDEALRRGAVAATLLVPPPAHFSRSGGASLVTSARTSAHGGDHTPNHHTTQQQPLNSIVMNRKGSSSVGAGGGGSRSGGASGVGGNHLNPTAVSAPRYDTPTASSANREARIKEASARMRSHSSSGQQQQHSRKSSISRDNPQQPRGSQKHQDVTFLPPQQQRPPSTASSDDVGELLAMRPSGTQIFHRHHHHDSIGGEEGATAVGGGKLYQHQPHNPQYGFRHSPNNPSEGNGGEELLQEGNYNEEEAGYDDEEDDDSIAAGRRTPQEIFDEQLEDIVGRIRDVEAQVTLALEHPNPTPPPC